MKKLKILSRLIYTLVGVVGIMSFFWAILNPDKFIEMPLWTILVYVIATIGSVNWGVVAITNDRNKDLFGLLGM